MAKFYGLKPPSSGQTSSKLKQDRSSSSAKPSPRFAGKRLENYARNSLFKSQADFAIDDSSHDSDSELNSSCEVEIDDDDDDDDDQPYGSSININKSIKAAMNMKRRNGLELNPRNKQQQNDDFLPLNLDSDSENDEMEINPRLQILGNGSDDHRSLGSQEEEDESENEEEDEIDSDSSIDSGIIALHQLHDNLRPKSSMKIKPPKKLSIPPPKKLDLPATASAHKSKVSSNKISGTDRERKNSSSSELSVISDDELNELEASISRHVRRGSIVDYSLDDKPVFPRSTKLHADQNAESSDSSTDLEDDEYSDGQLLAILSDDESSVEAENDDCSDLFDCDDEADDDDAIEESEERAILEEVEQSGDLEEPSKVGYQSEEEDFESDISFGNDSFFESRSTQNGVRNITSAPLAYHLSGEEDDDSYLWSYFFTSGDDSDETSTVESEILTKANTDSNGLERVQLLLNEGFKNDSGDSTDEDDTLPRAKIGIKFKPTEILSSSTATSRPPVLGSWVMSTERPYGIIDGLSTRTLSPPPSSDIKKTPFEACPADGSNEMENHHKRPRSSSIGNSFAFDNSDSELSELALDDFIYTSELEDKDDFDCSSRVDPVGSEDLIFLEFNRDIPLSAFRNRLSYPQFAFQANGAPRVRSSETIPTVNSQEATLTPVKTRTRQIRKRRRKRSKTEANEASLVRLENYRPLNDPDAEDFGTTDLIEELIGIGALSPLFGGIA